MRSRLAALPAWGWLTLIVVVSSLVRYAFARRVVAPWIVIDEIVYSELAKSFASSGHLSVRGVPTTGYGFVYPVVISPAYALFHAVPTAYAAVKAINSVAMSLAAVPAYLLARRVVSPRGALVVAVLTVAVPSTFYAGVVMTENAFYPLFLLAALALVVALETPSVRNVLLLLGAIGLAYETRAQAIALVPAALCAPLLLGPRGLARFRWLYGLVLGLGVLAVGFEVARGHNVRSLLGAYAAATHGGYSPREVERWLVWHVGELVVYVGVVPVVALVVLVRLLPSLAARERALVAAAVTVVALFSLEVAAFASQPSVLRIEERNLFYVAPLLFTALVLWVERGVQRPRVATALGAGGAVALVAAVPFGRFIGVPSMADTLLTLPLWSVSQWLPIALSDLRWWVAGLALVLALAAAFVPARAALVLPALVFVLYLAVMQPVDARTQKASIGALFQGITNPDRDWIDARVGRDADVAVLWSGLNDRLTTNENEFFNRSVGSVYTLRDPDPGNLAQTALAVDRANGLLVDAHGHGARPEYVLADTSLALAGRVVARDERKGLELLRLDGPLRTPYVLAGRYDDPAGWSGPSLVYTRFRCTGGTLAVGLGSDEHLFHRVQVVRARENGAVVSEVGIAPKATPTFRVPLEPLNDGTCVVRFSVAHTAVPARVRRGSHDTRRLGARFTSFTVDGRP